MQHYTASDVAIYRMYGIVTPSPEMAEARKHVGLTQRQLADLSGVSRSHIAGFEAQQRRMTQATHRRIWRAIGLALVAKLEAGASKAPTAVAS